MSKDFAVSYAQGQWARAVANYQRYKSHVERPNTLNTPASIRWKEYCKDQMQQLEQRYPILKK